MVAYQGREKALNLVLRAMKGLSSRLGNITLRIITKMQLRISFRHHCIIFKDRRLQSSFKNNHDHSGTNEIMVNSVLVSEGELQRCPMNKGYGRIESGCKMVTGLGVGIF